jgi:uncharacterized RDD family membrane protein YckC
MHASDTSGETPASVSTPAPSKHAKRITPGAALGPVAFGPNGVVIKDTSAKGDGGVHLPWDAVFPAVTAGLAWPVLMPVYFILLVAIVGQTPGMMISGLRVVRTDFRRPGPLQTIWRYVVAAMLWPFIMLLSPFSRVYVHDFLSGTRLIKNERALARMI